MSHRSQSAQADCNYCRSVGVDRDTNSSRVYTPRCGDHVNGVAICTTEGSPPAVVSVYSGRRLVVADTSSVASEGAGYIRNPHANVTPGLS